MSKKDKPKTKPSGEEIHNFRIDNPDNTWRKVGEHYGEPWETLKKRSYRYRRDNNITEPITNDSDFEMDIPPKRETSKVRFINKGDKAEAYSISTRIKTLDQLLSACEADLTKWSVSRYTINVWESGRKKRVVDLSWNHGVMDGFVEDSGDMQLTALWQVKAIFEPRKEEPYEKALEGLIERIKTYAPLYKPSKFTYTPINDGYLLVPNLYDVHLGKRSQHGKSYSLEQAKDDFIRIAGAIVEQAMINPKRISQIMFPVGNDLLHVDTTKETTSFGTWVETSVDIRNSIDAACEATTRAIELFATIAPVEVIPVEGNHDRLQTYWVGKYLQAFFANHPNVTVRDLKLERQYYQWGRVGLGLTHDGRKPQELTTLFPIEARHMWPDIEWTEWLTGHFHHQRGALYAVDSVRGTVVRTISALCDMDNYHSLHLYVGAHRAAEVLYYHKDNGPAGSFPIFVSELNR